MTRMLSFCFRFLSCEYLVAFCFMFSEIYQTITDKINLTPFDIMPYVFSLKLMKSVLKINETGMKEIQYKCSYKFAQKTKRLKLND